MRQLQFLHSLLSCALCNADRGKRPLPSLFSAVLHKGLEQLKAVYTEAEQAGITSLGRPLNKVL